MYQRISEIEFKSIKWVAVRAKPGQSLRAPFTRPAAETAILPAKQHGPSKRQTRRCTRLGRSGGLGSWRMLEVSCPIKSRSIKIFQDRSSLKSSAVTNVSVASVVSFVHFQFVLKPESPRKAEAFRRPIIFSALRP